MDDYARSISGYAWGKNDFGRFGSSLISYLINANLRLSDISPLTQIIAIIIAAANSCMLLYVFCGKRPTRASIAVSCLLGLAPSTISMLVFKFDAPCVALAVLAACTPLFLMAQLNKRQWFICAVLTQLIVWTTYQALSGVLISLLILKLLIEYMRGGIQAKDCVRYLIDAVLACAISAFVFYAIEIVTHASGYRSTEVAFESILANVVMYSSAAPEILTQIQKMLICLLVFLALASYIKLKMGAKTWFLTIVAGVMSFACAPGAYIFLSDAPVNARSMIGYAVWGTGALLCLNEFARNYKWASIASVISIVFAYTAIIFPLAFGNALAAQQAYSAQRNLQLAGDISSVLSNSDNMVYKINIVGDIGMAPEMAHIYDEYPATKYIFDLQSGLNGKSTWGYRHIINYYGDSISELDSLPDGWSGKTMLENHFQKIKLGDNIIAVEIKPAGGRPF